MTKIQDVYLKQIQSNYKAYCYYVNKDIGNGGWRPTKLHSFICDTVQKFVETDTGHAMDILLFSMPPQFGKSLTITETFASWYLGRNPKNKVIEVSYGKDLAQSFGKKNRDKVELYGRKIFGIGLSNDTKSATDWELDNGQGGMISRGVLSGVTGQKCNLLIIDDPIKNRAEADSETHRNKLKAEWLNSFRSRVYAGGKVIVIQTRWHEDDLYGYLEKAEENVTAINIPCEAEENDPLGRKVGEGLCEEIGKGTAWLKDFKKGYVGGTLVDDDGESGLRAWTALYQGHPVSAEGNILKRDWWQPYEYKESMKFDEMLLGVDATFKDKETSDYVAIEVWAKKDSFYYLIDCVNEHLNFMGTIREIKRLCAVYQDIKVKLIEDKANGTAIIEVLRQEIPGIIAIEPKGGKVARVNAVSYAVESGNVFLPENKHFTADFKEQCASFPNGKHDDMVDSFSMCLSRLLQVHTGNGKRERKRKPAFSFMEKRKQVFDRGDKVNVI